MAVNNITVSNVMRKGRSHGQPLCLLSAILLLICVIPGLTAPLRLPLFRLASAPKQFLTTPIYVISFAPSLVP